ncbi:MAG: pyruvate kinase [Alistipes sp.]
MNAARINSAHLTPEGADDCRERAESVGTDRYHHRYERAEIRITGMAPDSKGIPVSTGDIVRPGGTSPAVEQRTDLSERRHSLDVPAGSVILVDDGNWNCTSIARGDELVCKCATGVIYGRKSVNIPGVAIDLPSVTERDARFINWAIDMDVDFIAHSFVRKKEDVLAVKELIKRRNSSIKIISKIENKEGVDNIDEILDETYGIMVARGDLGVEIPAEQIPVAQRLLVSKCIESKKPVIIATQMLHTMITHPRPTRAEISDVANAIYQRVDAVMLSGETANGQYPVEAVKTMARVVARSKRIRRRTVRTTT